MFDAEDRPEPDQLRHAYEAFIAAGDRLACVQARLTIDNTDYTWLTGMFTAEDADPKTKPQLPTGTAVPDTQFRGLLANLVVQRDPSACLSRIKSASTGGVRVNIRRVAGFATWGGSAGHSSATASIKLTCHPDHSMGLLIRDDPVKLFGILFRLWVVATMALSAESETNDPAPAVPSMNAQSHLMATSRRPDLLTER